MARRLAARVGLDGALGVRFWDGSELPGDPGAPTAIVRGPRALAYLAREPNELGFGRAWVAGDLDVEGDLAETLALRFRIVRGRVRRADRLAALRAVRQVGALPLRAPRPPAAEAHLAGRLHSLRRDRSAVRHHYDVSNAFYRLVLGPTMVYSCAYFIRPDEDLETAQTRKLDVICRKLRLAEGERLLDIGCGWGSLVLHAAAR